MQHSKAFSCTYVHSACPSVCPSIMLQLGRFALECSFFGMQIHLHPLQVKVVYQGHRVKIEVTGASVCESCLGSNFDSLDLESSFFGTGYILRISRSSSYVKVVIGSRSRSREQKACLCVLSGSKFPMPQPGTFVFVCRYIFRISRSGSYIKVIGSRSRSQEQKSTCVFPVHLWLKGNLVLKLCLTDRH